MKKILITLAFIFSIGNLFSQNNSLPYFSENGVNIYVKKSDCVNTKKGTAIEYLLLEIENTNNTPINISFDKEMWFDNKCQTCNSNSDEYKVNLTLEKNLTIKGDCESSNNQLRIFSKMLNLDKVRKLTKYELKNIHIENIR